MLPEGATAPEFGLSGHRRTADRDDADEIREFSLTAMLDGGPALLAFYPGDFSPVCIEELCSLRDLQFKAVDRSAALYGVSRDGLFNPRGVRLRARPAVPAVERRRGRGVPRLRCRPRDGRRGGGGIEAGLPKRTLYVVDDDRTIRYAWQTEDPYEQPDLGAAVGTLAAD